MRWGRVTGRNRVEAAASPCEDKHGCRASWRNAAMVALALVFGDIAYRLVLSGCRVFAAYSPPAGSVHGSRDGP